MPRALILGGGFGGVSTAHELRRLGPEHEVILVSRSTEFMMGFRKTAGLVDPGAMEAGRRPLANLERHGVQVKHGDVTRVDPTSRAVDLDGETIEADVLVVALGAETVPAAIPGLTEHAHNVYDAQQIPEASAALASMQKGRVVVGIFGAPYLCPPAPYELTLLAQEAAQARGASLEFLAFTPQPMSLPVLGTTGCEVIEGRLGLRGIGFSANAKTDRIEADRVILKGGNEIPFDLLLAVPPHRCPQVLVDAGLAETGGWVKVNPGTLETSFEGVFAIGDCTAIPLANGQALPKAGVMAETEGRVVAERIVATWGRMRPEVEFDGYGACFLEIGGGEAMQVRGRFLAEPAPDVELLGPSPDLLAEKNRYERERLDTWFGAEP